MENDLNHIDRGVVQAVGAACAYARLVAEALQLVQLKRGTGFADRIVAATALALRVPLISRDRKIRASQVQTIW